MKRALLLPAALLSSTLTIQACDETTAFTDVAGAVVSFEVVSGDGQTGPVGEELPDPLVVRALDEKGKRVKDQLVNFRVIEGGGSMFAGASITDKDGIAQDFWTLGPEPGENVVEVRAVDATTGEKLVFARFTATASVVPGPGMALSFDGTSQFVEVLDDDVLDLAADFTLEAWIKPSSLTSFQHLISKFGTDPSYVMELNTDMLRGAIHANVVFESAAGRITMDMWHHVAVVRNGDALELYIDGALEGGGSPAHVAPATASSLCFARRCEFSTYYQGLMDEVRIWSVARSESEIGADMTRQLTGAEPGLVGYWRFDEGSGDVAFDATGNGNDGRLGSAVGADADDPVWTSDAAPIP